MPLLLTPRQLRYRAELYTQLGSLTAAGVGVIQACEMLVRNPPARSFRQPLKLLLDHLTQGNNFADSLARLPGWLPEFDIALLRAGETSGRLDSCFKILATYYEERAQLLRQMISDLAYPCFLLHFAILIIPFPQAILSGGIGSYLKQVLGILVPVYAFVFILLLACQGRHGEGWRAWIERFGRLFPLLGVARRELALARLSMALESLISAGVPIIEAWQMAANASGSPALKRAVAGWLPQVRAGRTPAETVRDCSEFPDVFASLYATGEMSGKLDDALRRLHVLFQDNGTRKMRALAQWVPRLIYIGICLAIGWYIVSFWLGYFSSLQKIMQ